MTARNIRVFINEQQKNALLEHAAKKGHTINQEIQAAIDFYLNGVSIEEWQHITIESVIAQQELSDMENKLNKLIKKIDRTFRQIEKIRENHDFI